MPLVGTVNGNVPTGDAIGFLNNGLWGEGVVVGGSKFVTLILSRFACRCLTNSNISSKSASTRSGDLYAVGTVE